MLAQNYVNIPLIFRASVSAYANDLANIEVNGWDSRRVEHRGLVTRALV